MIINYTLNTENKIVIELNANLELIAPVEVDTKIGEVTVHYDNHIILKIGILTTEEVRKKGVIDYMLEMGKNYSNYLGLVI